MEEMDSLSNCRRSWAPYVGSDIYQVYDSQCDSLVRSDTAHLVIRTADILARPLGECHETRLFCVPPCHKLSYCELDTRYDVYIFIRP